MSMWNLSFSNIQYTQYTVYSTAGSIAGYQDLNKEAEQPATRLRGYIYILHINHHITLLHNIPYILGLLEHTLSYLTISSKAMVINQYEVYSTMSDYSIFWELFNLLLKFVILW